MRIKFWNGEKLKNIRIFHGLKSNFVNYKNICTQGILIYWFFVLCIEQFVYEFIGVFIISELILVSIN